MIVVIADDLTGAAEVGGVAVRHGLTCEVQTLPDLDAGVEVIVLDTDTRSCSAEEAVARVAEVGQSCRQCGFERVFKKVDSVLRGHVAEEIRALQAALGRERALLVPANPGLGRIIRGGRYLVDGVPLAQTDFAHDPSYPAETSDVLELLGGGAPLPLSVCRVDETLPLQGIVVGEVVTADDVRAWADRLDPHTLPVGAAEFFAAYLQASGYPSLTRGSAAFELASEAGTLFVSGSSSMASRSFCQRCESLGVPVVRLPVELLAGGGHPDKLIAGWCGAASRAFEHNAVVVLAIDRPVAKGASLSGCLSEYLAECAARVLDARSIEHVFVEGGETAAALVHRMGWARLRVKAELAPGVVSLRTRGQTGPVLTMKPGSYRWPDAVWALISQRS